MFVSCKDYDDDINNLQQQIDKLNEAIKAIEAKIQEGKVITDVNGIANGIEVTMSDGSKHQIVNGKDGANGANGKDGISWTIGEDGYWYKDGQKTNYKAQGEKGDKGDKGDQGEQGPQGPAGSDGTSSTDRYYVPNADTGCFDVYVDGKKVESTSISFLGTGTITAVKDGETLTLYGVEGAGSEPVVLSLSGNLRGLVFVPNLYMDGIETVEYPWLQDSVLKVKKAYESTDRNGKKVSGLVDYDPNTLPNNPNGSTAGQEVFNYGPAWRVKYHMNPSNANTQYADIVGYNVLNPTIINEHSRAAVDQLGVSSPEKNFAGDAMFKNENGFLTAGLQVKNPQLLEKHPTINDVNENSNTVALQAKTKNSAGEEAIVTSDYALLVPTKAYIEALTWNKAPMYAASVSGKRTGDELGHLDANARVHVWDTPEEALQDKDGAALEVYYDSKDGINLSQYLGIHYAKENLATHKYELKTWTYGQEKEWGLSYEFNLVDYTVDGNKTHDSSYAKWVDQKNGVVRAWNVKYDGTHADGESATSIDREPLVQVLVKNAEGKVVLDGYILLHITKKAVSPEEKPNTAINLYPAKDAKFNLCDAAVVYETNWSEFNDYVLTNGLDNMTKEEFDAQYEPDLVSATAAGTDQNGYDYFHMNMYDKALDKGGVSQATAQLGEVLYYPNSLGTTNHRFDWLMDEATLEKLTHDTTTPVAVTRYIRFKAKNQDAKYPYVYVKLTVNLTRDNIGKVAFGEKNENYWFGLNGSDEGKEAVVFDVKEPIDGGNIVTFNRGVRSTLVGNMEKVDGTRKYYFAPVKDINITAQNGTSYKLTVASDQLVCKYVSGNNHKFDVNTLDNVLNTCAIDYSAGVFNNNKLFANGVAIASLNQQTGEIELIKNTESKAVLNAIGYEKNHANIEKELRAWIGLVAESGCGLAKQVTDGTFLASWQRPINLNPVADKAVVDANTNGNIIYLIDLLNMYDWRGPESGNMEGENKWFWAYYGVKAITVDCDPAHVLTNMHSGSFQALNKVTTEAELYAYKNASDMVKGSKTFSFNLSSYNSKAQNAALLSYIDANKSEFGAIFYKNNGDNVTEFDLKIPVTVSYEWGDFETVVTVHVSRTLGH